MVPDFVKSSADILAYQVAVDGGWADWICHVSDLRAIEAGMFFDVESAKSFARFCAQKLKHHRVSFGAKPGDPWVLIDWQYKVIGRLLGWRKADGRRRFRKLFLSMGKKNGKTSLIAALLLWFLLTEKANSEIFSAASTRDQASLVFHEAIGLVEASKWLSKKVKDKNLTIIPSTKRIIYENKTYKALSNDAGGHQGLNISVCIVDELCEWKSRELFDKLAYAGDAQVEPLMIIITTAGEDIETIWGEEYQKAKRWLAGEYEDLEYLAVIYEAAVNDDWTSVVTWRKANPSLGYTVSLEDIQRQCRAAKDNPAEQARFKLYKCNIPTSLNATWIDMVRWDSLGRTSAADLLGRECYAGVDPSAIDDTTALVLWFPNEDNTADVLSWIWLPEDNIHRLAKKHGVSYETWVEQGHLHLTKGNSVDQDVIINAVHEVCQKYQVRQIGIDRGFQGLNIEQKLVAAGYDVVPAGQGWRSQSEPAKNLERMIFRGAIRWDGNPVLRWHVSNVVCDKDKNDNYSISKKKSRSKIDGVAAMLMAIYCSMQGKGEGEELIMDFIPSFV